MGLDKKILSEINRYKSINKYITEQTEETEIPPVPGEDLGPLSPEPGAVGATAPAAPVAPPPPPAAPTSEPLDVANDPDVELIDDEGGSEENDEGGSEELDITELVNSQNTIQTKQDEYFENLFSQLNDLQSRLGEMDNIMSKLNTLENKIEKYREKTPQEKLELRSYDSYPFNQKLSQFFDDKSEEMEKTGKNDYVLTSDEVQDINVNDIKNSFQPGGGEDKDSYKTSFR
jgi:TolA-binding protein